MMKHTKKAFTLVELIIVITILAILATIGFMSYQSYTSDARNSKRVNDLSSLQSKLEIMVAKSTDISTLVTRDATTSEIVNGHKAGSGTSLTGGTNYYAGTVKYSAFGVDEADFKDPGSGTPAYKLAVVTSTNLGKLYQFGATIESTGDEAKKAKIVGLFLTGGTLDNARGLLKGTGSTTAASGVLNDSKVDFPY